MKCSVSGALGGVWKSLFVLTLHVRAGYAKDHAPCVIFMDEVDAIGGKRMNDGSSADREIQRTLMEVRSNNVPYNPLVWKSLLFLVALQLLNQ